MSLAEKLVSLRKQNGFTQMELAERLDVSRQAISRWEVGTSVPSTDNLKFLSELYGVTLDYLLGENIDDFSKDGEQQEQKNNDDKGKAEGRKNFVFIFAVLALIIMLLAIGMPMNRQERENVTPIEDMPKIIEDDYPGGTFSIE